MRLSLCTIPQIIDDNIESHQSQRQLKGGPTEPELTLTTSDSIITGTADFNQGGQQTIRLFKKNCSDKFETTSGSITDYAEFVVTSTPSPTPSVGSVYSASGNANDDVVFELSMAELYSYLVDNTGVAGGTDGDAKDGGEVTVCIQLESVNTIKNYIQKITIDLTHSATINTDAAQPDASVEALNIATDLTAWICDETSDDASTVSGSKSSAVGEIEVPGRLYVCIEVTDGYEIQLGELAASSDVTTPNPSHSITNYMSGPTVVTTGAWANDGAGIWSQDDTVQTWTTKKNLVRVSIIAPSNWAATATSTATDPPASTVTVQVTAQFDPVRRLATVAAHSFDETAETNRHLRQRDDEIIIYAQDAQDKDEDEDSQYHWGRLRPDGGKAAREKPKLKTSIFAESAMEFAQATTTVLVHGPAPVDNTLSIPIAGVIAGTILLCCSCCCFFLGACWRRRRDDDEEEEEHEKNSDTGSVDTYTENDLSSKGSSSRPPAIAFVYDIGTGIYDVGTGRHTNGQAA